MSASFERRAALDILLRVEQEGAYSSILLREVLARHPEWESRSKALITNLVYTVLANDLRLNCMIDRYSKVSTAKMDPQIAGILRLSAAQMLFMDKIPHSAAVSEAVEMTREFRPGLCGFVNAVLRAMLRADLRESWPEANQDPEGHLSVRYSIPLWIIQLWVRHFGLDRTRKIAKNLCASRGISLRVNTVRTTTEKLRDALSDRYEVSEGVYCPEALRILKGNPAVSPEFAQGLFTIQDESSMLAVHVLDPQPGESVLDLCSAPGGKATHMAERMQNRGRVCARDLYEHKIKLIRQNVGRLGASIVTAEKKDASVCDPADREAWDRVLLDAPCSGLGILRNKPDLKLHVTPQQLGELASLQRTLLNRAAECCRKGGVLVYSTCTLDPQENEANVEHFLETHPDWEAENPADFLPDTFPKENQTSYGVYVFPQENALDGFFIARLHRKG